MSIRIDVAGGPLSVDASLRPACLHVNEAAAAALGVQARRLAATIDCADCALVDFELVARQRPSRPEFHWRLDGLMNTLENEWVFIMSRLSDGYTVTGSGRSIAAAVRRATEYLQDGGYDVPIGAMTRHHQHHVDGVCSGCAQTEGPRGRTE